MSFERLITDELDRWNPVLSTGIVGIGTLVEAGYTMTVGLTINKALLNPLLVIEIQSLTRYQLLSPLHEAHLGKQ